jgi:hypothetical protein
MSRVYQIYSEKTYNDLNGGFNNGLNNGLNSDLNNGLISDQNQIMTDYAGLHHITDQVGRLCLWLCSSSLRGN